MRNINDFDIRNGVLVAYRGSDENVVIPNSGAKIECWIFEGCASV